MILFGLFSRHRSLKLKMIKSDRNVDVGKTSAEIFHFEPDVLSVFFLFISALKMLRANNYFIGNGAFEINLFLCSVICNAETVLVCSTERETKRK